MHVGLFNRPFVPPRTQMLSYSVVAQHKDTKPLSYT
jgi:hypothetical protein